MSFYNNKWCSYPSAQVHEIGHNYGLGHSGHGNNRYGDTTVSLFTHVSMAYDIKFHFRLIFPSSHNHNL